MIGVVALGALIASLPVMAQQKAKEPPKPVEIPKGVFLDVQPGDSYLARDTVLFAKVRDTSGKITKTAVLKDTKHEMQVSAFVEIGDKIEIDTESGEFKRRCT